MQRILLFVLLTECAFAADRQHPIEDLDTANALRQRYLTLTDSWAQDVEFTASEKAAMEAGKKWEPLMMKGPDDPLGKKILAAGDASFESVASYYPGKILDRTILGTYSDPHRPMSQYSDEFAIYWNGAIACNLIKGRLTERYGATGIQPLALNTVVQFRVGPKGEPFGRVRPRYSSIGYESGYLPIVVATYDVDGVRYRETAFADQPKNESGGWDIAYVRFEMTNIGSSPR